MEEPNEISRDMFESSRSRNPVIGYRFSSKLVTDKLNGAPIPTDTSMGRSALVYANFDTGNLKRSHFAIIPAIWKTAKNKLNGHVTKSENG